MSILSLPLATRGVQIGIGAAALAGGTILGGMVIKHTYRNDLLGDPTRIVDIADGRIIDQSRSTQGPGLTKAFMGVGAVMSGVGAAVTLGGGAEAAKTGARALLRHGGGALLFAGGLGLIAGSIAASMQYTGSDVRLS